MQYTTSHIPCYFQTEGGWWEKPCRHTNCGYNLENTVVCILHVPLVSNTFCPTFWVIELHMESWSHGAAPCEGWWGQGRGCRSGGGCEMKCGSGRAWGSESIIPGWCQHEWGRQRRKHHPLQPVLPRAPLASLGSPLARRAARCTAARARPCFIRQSSLIVFRRDQSSRLEGLTSLTHFCLCQRVPAGAAVCCRQKGPRVPALRFPVLQASLPNAGGR